MRGADYYVDQAILTLQARLPAKLAELNAEVVAPQLEVPLGYHAAGKRPIPAYPAVEVAIASKATEGFDIAYQAGDVSFPLVALLWCQDASPDTDVLIRKAWRYGRALVEVLTQSGAAGPGTIATKVQEDYAADIEPGSADNEVFRSFALCVVNYEVDDVLSG